MTLTLKPKGRGNWHTLLLAIDGSRAQALLFQVGDLIPLAGVVYRICKVSA